MSTGTRDSKNHSLMIGGVKASALARRYGTPLYVYDHEVLVGNFRRIRDAFAPLGALIAFSMKANSSAAVLRTLIREGAGLDIVSGGELQRGLRAGVEPGRIIYAGVGKTTDEIRLAIEAGIRAFNVESEPEAEAIAAVGRKLRATAPVAIRVNPDVDAATHHYITTGRKENKFGIPLAGVRKLFRNLAKLKGIAPVGLHTHIGSQILKSDAYVEALERVAELVALLRRDGHDISLINLGGGFGIAYEDDQQPLDMTELAGKLVPTLAEMKAEIIFEPGRSVVGPAGYLLTRVIYIKQGEIKNFAIVDGAMNDLIRPSLYSAYHRILLDGAARRGRRSIYDVVGPICESGDFLGKERTFPALAAGDLLMVCDAGAYGMTMASNYNSRPRPAEVMVKGARHYLARRRETFEDLVAAETMPEFLEK